METKTAINGKRLFIHQLSKPVSTSDPPVKMTNPDASVPSALATALPTVPVSVPAATPTAASVPASSGASKTTVISRKEVAPTTRIVVVRAKGSAKAENGEEAEPTIVEQEKSVELPALLTDGVSCSSHHLFYVRSCIILANVGLSHSTANTTG